MRPMSHLGEGFRGEGGPVPLFMFQSVTKRACTFWSKISPSLSINILHLYTDLFFFVFVFLFFLYPLKIDFITMQTKRIQTPNSIDSYNSVIV